MEPLLEMTPSSSSNTLVTIFRKLHEFALRQMMKHLGPEGRNQMLEMLLRALVYHSRQDRKIAREFFLLAQSRGFHILPVHFYSPIPNTGELPEKTWSHRFDRIPGWSLNRARQLELLEKLAWWAPEMADTPTDRRVEDPPSRYFWNNTQFNSCDGVIYHSLIRHLKPAVILEIGCGYSTMVAARAAMLNGNTRLTCIEPFPIDALAQGIPGVERLIDKPLQEVPVTLFENLQANDILFVDSTHVSKVGSDVNYVVFEILPRLKPGVVVHFHDIFLPWDYPKDWVMDHHLFWNEQYLILAFLLFNEEFEILYSGNYIAADEKDLFDQLFPYVPAYPRAYGGCSLWIRRKG